MQTFLQPWKLFTLTLGLLILVAGSFYEKLPDWDVGDSLLMGVLAYLTAPYFVRSIWLRKWRALPLASFLAWLTIDGSYWLYNAAMHHPAFRDANWPASTALYLLCGVFWSYNGSTKQLITEMSSLRRS